MNVNIILQYYKLSIAQDFTQKELKKKKSKTL